MFLLFPVADIYIIWIICLQISIFSSYHVYMMFGCEMFIKNIHVFARKQKVICVTGNIKSCVCWVTSCQVCAGQHHVMCVQGNIMSCVCRATSCHAYVHDNIMPCVFNEKHHVFNVCEDQLIIYNVCDVKICILITLLITGENVIKITITNYIFNYISNY